MAISHELSSEIATALFSASKRSLRELSDLKDVILKVHSTLEQLAREARAAHQARADRATLSQRAKVPAKIVEL